MIREKIEKIVVFASIFILIGASESTLLKRVQRSAATCGVTKISSGYIVRGQSFTRGNFPWIVALTYTKVHPPIFFCGGTIISPLYVISAAHCINDKYSNNALLPRDILAFFGAHDLGNHLEAGRYSLSPKKIILHEDWNPRTTQFDGDVSLLEFESGSILFNNFVQPICLWNADIEPTGIKGIVPGWGKSEDSTKKYENIPKMVKVTILNNAQCLPGEKTLAEHSSHRTFCAGHHNGSGVCFGDSGGGLFIKVKEIFYLKGIVSSSLTKNAGTECDVSKKAVYTDVLKFTDWISHKTGLALTSLIYTDTTASPANAAREVSCTTLIRTLTWSTNQKRNLETCVPDIDEVDDEDFTISSLTDPTIPAFAIEDKIGVKFLPTNLAGTFNALLIIAVWNCSVISIENHFKGLSKLKVLNLGRNKITDISSDAFADLISLEAINLNFNRIQFLDANIFSTLMGLKILQLSNNRIATVHPMVFRSLVKVEQLILQQNKILGLDENIFGNMTSLTEISLAANKLETISKNLFKNNLRLEKIWLSINNIKLIDSKMFEHLTSLKYVNLGDNSCIHKIYNENNFDVMRNDLQQNCTLGAMPGTATSKVPTNSVTATILTVDRKNSSQAAREVSCTTLIASWNWSNQKQNLETCYPNIADDNEFSISAADEEVSAVNIRDRKSTKLLPTNIARNFPNLIVLQVFNCSVTSINHQLADLKKLKLLNLSRNKIEKLSIDAFVDLISLEQLQLQFNRITFLGKNIFDPLEMVQSIFLNNNKIQVLDPKIFGYLAKVEAIALHQNRISGLDENIFENTTSLKLLSLSANKLEKIPKNTFKNNLKLEYISLSINNIKFIDASVFTNLGNLKHVDLKENPCINKSYNQTDFDTMASDLNENCTQEAIVGTTEIIDTTTVSENPITLVTKKQQDLLPSSAAKVFCRALIKVYSLSNQILPLESCRPDISEIDGDFEILTSTNSTLSALVIENKQGVKSLPTNLFRTLPDLVVMLVQNCSISLVKEFHFKGLAALRYLSLARNKIEHVASDAFVDLIRLEQLLLSVNKIQLLGDNTFSTLQALKGLDLGENKIKVLHPKIFGLLVKVEIINLEKNEISAIDENIFENVTSLKGISLAANQLDRIPKHLFINNLILESINLDKNNITFIDATMFDHLASLNFVSLQENSCIDKIYRQYSFDVLRTDVKQKCTENLVHP